MKVKDAAATIGGLFVSVAVLGVLALLGTVFIFGSAWVSARLLPWFSVLTWITFALAVFVFLPLAIPKATRSFSSVALLITSYVFGITLWMEGLLLTIFIWGFGAAFIGLFLLGVGVVPVAMLATLLNGVWGPLIELVLLTILTFACRAGALSLGNSLQSRERLQGLYCGDAHGAQLSQTLQMECEMSEEEAVDIAVEFGEAYAICNEEKLLFKPQSLLPREPKIVVHAMKVSYQMGYPLPEQLEQSYRHCFPQISFFIKDDQFDRAKAYFARFFQEIKREPHHRASFDYQEATVNSSSAPSIATYTEPFSGHSLSGAELAAKMDEFFECEFLVHAPADPDKEWVQQLARNCWRNLRARINEWAEFVALVQSGDSGLERREVAVARIEVNKKKREIDDYINSLRPANRQDEHVQIAAPI